VSAACLLARREALEAVGGFDEGFFLYEEDVDLCVRMRRAGWDVLFTPDAEVVHHLGQSMRKDPWLARFEYHRSHIRYYAKHNGVVQTAALRGFVATGAGLAWLASLGPGATRADRRRHEAAVVRLALGDEAAQEPGRKRRSE
jgi:GT2 family glycosyltransferase